MSITQPMTSIRAYTGPYERWLFTQELGYPFAFPALREKYQYVAAIYKGEISPDIERSAALRFPPLWPSADSSRTVTPFAFINTADDLPGHKMPAIKIAQSSPHKTALDCSSAAPQRFDYRVNVPIHADSWVAEDKYEVEAALCGWKKPSIATKVIVAVIDDGIPFGHRAFLDAQGGSTRISHCWLQAARVSQKKSAVPFGREYVNAEIDTLRASAADDDALFYRLAGAVDMDFAEIGSTLCRRMTHGAHVMGMCAGNGATFTEQLDDSVQIIAVQLPNTVAWDTSGFGKEMHMLSALHYIFNRATAIAAEATKQGQPVEELPLIINFSYGWNAGRHDGESDMEIAIQQLLEARAKCQPKTALVMPSGNTFDHKMHAQFTEFDFSSNCNSVSDTVSIGWQLPPDDRTSSYLEVWLPKHFDPAGYLVRVSSPAGQTLQSQAELYINPVSEDHAVKQQASTDQQHFTELTIAGKNIGQLSSERHNGNRWRVLLALIPSTYCAAEERRSPAGLWKIDIIREDGAAQLGDTELIDIWLQRDDDPVSLKMGGRPSYLVNLPRSSAVAERSPSIDRQLSGVTGYGSLNGIASSENVIRVGGYVHDTGLAASYSSCGGVFWDKSEQTAQPNFRQEQQQIDFMAVSDHSLLQPGTPSIGVFSGATSRLTGTSGAAPAVVRLAVINAVNDRPLFCDLNKAADIDQTASIVTGPAVNKMQQARSKPDSRVKPVTRI